MNDKYKPFSERRGRTQPKPFQREMDDDLRTGLWNAFYESFPDITYEYDLQGPTSNPIYRKIFGSFLKKPLNEYDDSYINENNETIQSVFRSEEWYRVFDLVEYVTQICHQKDFVDRCNAILKQENSAYIIIAGGYVSEITSKQEIEEIETALQIPFDSAKSHLEKALAFFSDRQDPDYKNSISESIDAVESIAKEITGKEKSLKALTQELNLHSNLVNALNELYDWTSKDGIRHGGSNKSLSVNQDTARFMLVICSAFVNYIIARNSE